MKHIFDASFKYTPSLETDLRKSFERIRHELQGMAHDTPDASGNRPTEKVVQLQSRKPGA